MTTFAGWQNFYVIVGSSAGALIGLQFVVLTLIAGLPIQRSPEVADAFATPTTTYFGTVLLLSALLCAPWRSVAAAAVVCCLVGLIGLAYAIVVAWRIRTQKLYKPEFEDWLFHAFLPIVGYAALAISGFAIRFRAHNASFGIASASLLLLFIGIHNAWDAVTYQVFVQRATTQPKSEQQEAEHINR